jgi:hypothetical protein
MSPFHKPHYRFVAVYQGGSHRAFTSLNGIVWTKVVVSLNAWNSVAWSPQLSLLCAVADSGTGNRVMTSIDGANWVDGSISDNNWESIVWSDLGVFVAVATNGYMAYSTDGFIWIESVLSGTLRGISWSNDLSLFLVVGIINYTLLPLRTANQPIIIFLIVSLIA